MRLPLLDKYLIDKEFQYSYILRNLFLLVFVMVSTILIIVVWNKYRFFHSFLLEPPTNQQVQEWARYNNVKDDSAEYAYQFIAQAKAYSFYKIIIYPVIVIFLVNLLVISIVSLYISYKIAVPLHAVKIAMRKKLETGQFEKPLKVYEGDPFHELTSLSNLLLFVAAHPGVKHFVNAEEDGQKQEKQKES